MRVLVTRPEPDAAIFAERCRSAGLTPIVSPLMRVSFNELPVNLSGVGALAFTSANGVRAFSAASENRNLPVFAIGAATGESAHLAGFDNISVAGGDIKSLTSLIDQDGTRMRGAILHVAGEHRAGDLVGALNRRCLEARREVLYEARAVDILPDAAHAALAASPPVEWASFFSPRTAALFLALVKKAGIEDSLRRVRAACLSDAVAEIIANAAWKSVEVASSRDADGVILSITRKAPEDCA